MLTEHTLEAHCLHWFQDTGWHVAYGPDIGPDSSAPERTDYRQVILRERLLAALARINTHIPATALEDAVHALHTISEPQMVMRNRSVHRLLLNGMPVECVVGDEKKTDWVQFIDFQHPSNNDFLAVNQFTIIGHQQLRRPDVIAFVNGLPLAVVELKNPANEHTDIWDAFNQLQTYKDEISDLFNSNVALVISDGWTARVGSLTADTERMLPWRTIDHENDRPRLQMELETVVRGFFKPELFLDYVRHCVLFEQNDVGIIKKIAGYHQFHAAREAVRATVMAAQQADKRLLEVREAPAGYGKDVTPGSRKAGVVWHTQGSGKSITMACYAGKLLQQPDMKNPTLVVVTDRTDLDSQLFATFSAASDLFKTTPVRAENRQELRALLASREAGGIIFTTVQKFALLEGEDVHPLLSDRANIVVISDEAHRSQYGTKGTLHPTTGKYMFGYAKHLRDALQNATFIGFTATPIAQEDKDTRTVFGDYISIYDIQDAVDDGATVSLFYESRLAKLDVNQAEIDALNAQVDELFEEEEDIASREKTKSEWAALEKLVGSAPRVHQVARDLIQHFEARVAVMDGKAMIVCMSRDICVQLYNAICIGDAHTPPLRPEWHSPDPKQGAIKIVMTGSTTDKALLKPHLYSTPVKKRLEERFKDVKDPLKLVIVRDMWLTGFDVPCCHTMYIDKPMKGHTLLQAIARVNRVFKNKPGGLVVDYIGIAKELKVALKTYTAANGKGDPTHNAAEAMAVLREKLDIVRGMMHGFDYSAFETQALPLLVPAANHLLGLQDGKARFLDTMAAISKAFALCGTLDEAAALRKEIAFFSAIKAAIVKFTTVDKKRRDAEKNSALKQILDNAIIADGVADVFALAGLDTPNIQVLSDEFLEDVCQMKSRHVAVELLEKLLRDAIKARASHNIVQEKKYGDRLLEALRKYHNRAIETAQVIEALIQMAKEFQATLEREATLGLTHDEIAFYDALANNESAVRELGDEVLKKIAIEITEKLRASTTVDWQVRESVRAKLRILVRRCLQKWKYPPDQQPNAVELVLQQAEELSNHWTV
ncbi:type I restriction endonuclease subunit R [Xylella taiwanensis]|uniref:Type I restriction enzyme endonuclease subunit n=1 Tax=Xylella taiwanensis TaxID=1444770 RepID=A0ABS8TWX8_9GAMM|nr:type I restriction endonuclease subunit R [Xylella taiwanensis]MCD8455722.1 type I restriction endonuclease subunit R [Xylella taiwanensis]MCD8458128.1 type I restriction endonuclease subunit R [Xylella taiwanensis]MCD8463679.1 type I restriction endonuclease subunit R [Xylella taiwanensis]MCD8469990.1 type I restriction endonuclease subunit R [Xylella taiwanensis]MCD8473057.1 type I restriction endonuclease subunit R [Xylella taiwanensis]